jgi:hypothetical protein
MRSTDSNVEMIEWCQEQHTANIAVRIHAMCHQNEENHADRGIKETSNASFPLIAIANLSGLDAKKNKQGTESRRATFRIWPFTAAVEEGIVAIGFQGFIQKATTGI